MLYVIRDKFGSALAVLWGALKSFSKNNNFSTAASLAYCSLFAMVPILLLLFFTMSLFITSSKAVMQRITALIAQFIPYYSDAVLKEVYTLARHKGTWGLISMGALLWASMPLVGTLRTAFFEIFRIEKRPSFLKTKLLDISVILITISLFVTVSFSNLVFKEFLIFKGNKVLYDIASYGLITIIMFVFYLVFIPKKVPLRYFLVGAILTMFMWEIMRPVFGLFLSYNPRYGITFGSLKAIFIIIIWVYYSFSVLLFGAEVIANLERRDILMLRELFYDSKTSSRLENRFGRRYKSNDIIFKEDDKGNDMYFIVSGSVRLSRMGQILKVMQRGEYFGEMSLLIGIQRTMTAQAEEDNTRVIAVNTENFETLLREEPKIAILLLRELANRIKDTDERFIK